MSKGTEKLGRTNSKVGYGKPFKRKAVKAVETEPGYFHVDAIVKTNGLTTEQCEKILADVTKRVNGGEVSKFSVTKLYGRNKLLKGI